MPREFTKQAIIQSFVKLLQDRPLDKISVKDIVMDCNINRNTFYYYYQDIYDLLGDLFDKEMQLVIDECLSQNSWQDGFKRVTHFLVENKKIFLHIYHTANREEVERHLYRTTQSLMEIFVGYQARDIGADPKDIRRIAMVYSHAIVGAFTEWLRGNLKGDIEADVLRIGQLMDGTARRILEKSVAEADADSHPWGTGVH